MAQDVLFVEYPKCSTCKKAKQWLEGHGVQFADRDIVNERPTADELREWHRRSGLPLRRFFNTSGMLYREMELAEKAAGHVRGGANRAAVHQRHAGKAPAAGNRCCDCSRLQGSRVGRSIGLGAIATSRLGGRRYISGSVKEEPMSFTVRFGEEVDAAYLDKLVPVDQACYSEEYWGDPQKTVDRYLKNRRSFVFVEDDETGRLAGYINFFPCEEGLYLDNLERCPVIRDDDILPERRRPIAPMPTTCSSSRWRCTPITRAPR